MAQTDTRTGTVAGYFDSKTDAARAVEALKTAGFSSAHLGMAHYGDEEAGSTKTAEGAKHEGEPGMWDKIKHMFEGGAEPYADEQAKGDLATREITADPTASYGNVEGEDLHHNLSGLDVPADRSRYFGHKLNSSDRGAVVTVNAGMRYDEAASILTKFGGDVGEGAEGFEYPAASPATQVPGTQAFQTDQRRNIQLLGEVLRVQKERVSRGEVTFRKETITEMQTIQVPVTREELIIERHAVSGSTAVEGAIGSGETIRIPLSEERAMLEKSTVVREEASVGKRTVADVRDLTGEVRHEDLVVEENTEVTR